MKEARFESSSDVVRWLQREAAGLWPAAVGSLSFRRSPCVRENCPACMSGEQHPSYVLYGRLNGRRVAVYVPEELARFAGADAAGCAALRQGIEARAGEGHEEQEEPRLSSVESSGTTGQLCRLGVDAAGHAPGAAAAGDFRLP